MNIFCHSSVIDIESDGNGSIVFADSESGEKGTSVSAPENPDECRKMLKKVVADWKKDCCCRRKITSAGENNTDEGSVSRNFIQVGSSDCQKQLLGDVL